MPWVACSILNAHFVTAVSLVMGEPWLQRSFRLSVAVPAGGGGRPGRLHWKSVLVGGVLSLTLLNAPAFYLGLTPDSYPRI